MLFFRNFAPLVVATLSLLVFSLPSSFGKDTAPRTSAGYVQRNVKAHCALLVNAQTGQVLFSRRPTETSPPASTIKLLTALVAYQTKGMSGSLKIQQQDTRAQPSSVPIIAGETISISDLFHALLIESANDAALALARYAGGTVEQFVGMMNAKAAALGCKNSRFKNPNGLPIAGQYTCAEDMMKIFEAAIAIPEIREICCTKRFFLKTAAKRQWLKNHNRLLGVYPGMGPAKTGWTYASRHTYAASVTRNGVELHLVLLNSPNKWADAPLLLDYGFAVAGAQRSTASTLSTKN